MGTKYFYCIYRVSIDLGKSNLITFYDFSDNFFMTFHYYLWPFESLNRINIRDVCVSWSLVLATVLYYHLNICKLCFNF